MNLLYSAITILILNFCLVLAQKELEQVLGSNCTEVRDTFADASSAFIKCSIQFSRPIKFCEECVGKYINVLNSFNNFSQVANNGTPCINSFINLDRLGIIHTLYANSVDLWSRAKCSECYVTENGTQTDKISNQTKHFTSLYENFTTCLTNSADDLTCIYCMDDYVLLQNYFLSISNENEKIGACMDIVDMMNTTWTFWGERCCRYRRHNEYTFIISTVVVLCATVLFYVVAQIYAKKKSPTIIEQTRFLNTLDT